MILGIVTLPIFKQEALRCKNCYFCYLYMESWFSLIWIQKCAKCCYVTITIFKR